jgi:hypothetical protein
MRLRFLTEFALSASILLASAGVASAQTTVAAMYNPLLHELSENSSLGAHGDVATVWGPISVLGEVGVNHFDQATVITVAPGIRYVFDSDSKIQPAVQAVFGLWHCGACETSTSFLQGGGLVDFGGGSSWKFRAQFDVRRIFFEFGGETAERIGVGVVWTLK